MTVFALFGVKMSVILLILGFAIAYFHLKSESVMLVVFFPGFPCYCLFIGSSIYFYYSLW